MPSYNNRSNNQKFYYHCNEYLPPKLKERFKNVKKIISESVFIELITDFFLFIADKIVEGEVVVLPEGIGTIKVVGKEVKPYKVEGENKYRGISVNWGKTKKLWETKPQSKEKKELVYNFNEHSDGYTYSVKWYKGYMKTSGESIYSFRLYRQNKREISRKIITEEKEYLKL